MAGLSVAAPGAAGGPTDADLRQCISCGLCLPACPTYRLTGRESASPRGRIALMRQVVWDGAPIDAEYRERLDFCLQCRACETACPAGVPFGRMMEGARAQVERALARPRPERWLRWLGLHVVLPRRALILLLTFGAWLAQRVGLGRRGPIRLLPPLRLRTILRTPRPAGPETGERVQLFRGCVQDAWFRPVNDSAARVLGGRGFRVEVPSGQTCCGALHAHYGRLDDARRLAGANVSALVATDGPIVVASAGCGAAMKEWGDLLGTPAAYAVAARVRDVTELLAVSPADDPATGGFGGGAAKLGPVASVSRSARPGAEPRTPRMRVAVHDPCHLVHAQRITSAPRLALGGFDLADVADSTVCCGAAGLYNILQPAAAAEFGRRKAAAIIATGAGTVAVANPGCAMQIRFHLADAGRPDIVVAHPVELIAARDQA